MAVAALGRPEEPPADCPRCPRLAAFRAANRRTYPGFHNAPVPSFGSLGARLLVVGLAPGLKGANRTARPFTGDFAGDLLYATLAAHGLARGTYGRAADDGLTLRDCRITNAVRCVPPENKPTGTETRTCNAFLAAEIAAMPDLRAILALGALAHGAVLTALGGVPRARHPFVHGALYAVGRLVVAASYHCSRYNTNVGVLTPAMFDAVFRALLARLDRPVAGVPS